ncbi:MAG TPA: hypothetical protein PKA28_17580 [Methylomusa anaerophila]|nr:hypothetical protein [Methylomusa anaerophila]HML90255.1 hypothetical protein [Methylomusa anaerophila]
MNVLLPENIDKIRMVKRPVAVPYNYRIMYKLAQIVLIMAKCCINKGCSMQKVQMISSGLSSKDEFDRLRSFIEGKMQYPIIRYDPSINRAIVYALAEKLLFKQGNGLFRLTPKGKEFASALEIDEPIMALEKDYLREISNRLTEDKIKSVIADWRTFDVQN